MAVEPQDRIPAQIEADQRWLAELRAKRAADPRRGKFGGAEEITEELLTGEVAS
jgi:hypothetical protein